MPSGRRPEERMASKSGGRDPMSTASPRFVSDLTDALRRGMEEGRLTEQDLDPILHAVDFDPAAFDVFLTEARLKGIRLPEVELGTEAEVVAVDGAAEAPAPADAPSEHDAATVVMPARGVADLERRYLKEIQRYPILERDIERSLWERMRGGEEGARK